MSDPDKVVSIHNALIPTEAVPNNSVIELLDRMREKALRGEVTSLAVAYLNGGYKACSNWSDTDRRLSLIAAVAFLQKDLMAPADD